MSKTADELRAQQASSTDPERLERMAREAQLWVIIGLIDGVPVDHSLVSRDGIMDVIEHLEILGCTVIRIEKV